MNKFTTKQKETNIRKPRGGWDEDGEESNEVKIYGTMKEGPFKSIPSNQEKSSKQDTNQLVDLINMEEDLNNYDYENKVIQDLIQVGGAKIKPSENLIKEFVKKSENLNNEIIVKILLISLENNESWISKARSIYALEALAKNNKVYLKLIKQKRKMIRNINFEKESSNKDQLHLIMDNLMVVLEEPEEINEKINNQPEIVNMNQSDYNENIQADQNEGLSKINFEKDESKTKKNPNFNKFKQTDKIEQPVIHQSPQNIPTQKNETQDDPWSSLSNLSEVRETKNQPQFNSFNNIYQNQGNNMQRMPYNPQYQQNYYPNPNFYQNQPNYYQQQNYNNYNFSPNGINPSSKNIQTNTNLISSLDPGNYSLIEYQLKQQEEEKQKKLDKMFENISLK